MRRTRNVIHMVAMLVLLAGFVPTSAIASLFITSCKMDCCVGERTHEAADPVCVKGCETENGHNSKPAQSIHESQSDDCKCSISSAPSTPQPDTAATAAFSFQVSKDIADLPVEQKGIIALSVQESEAGIFGTDSDPPSSRPNYACLGRAPPVHLA
ncbi:MAG: hypothetical protein KJZ62_10835 [Fimbriimonadaceae bacterium]|nr:hypothetical protein [Fimbriimonadaceae bacterium]MCL4285582.1 hypothetical protein [Fimbriimonadaceae bacterium]QOJ11209.1 MAG: hypothetical protein HRU74_03775 [Chthonomonadaceae bacterium]